MSFNPEEYIFIVLPDEFDETNTHVRFSRKDLWAEMSDEDLKALSEHMCDDQWEGVSSRKIDLSRDQQFALDRFLASYGHTDDGCNGVEYRYEGLDDDCKEYLESLGFVYEPKLQITVDYDRSIDAY